MRIIFPGGGEPFGWWYLSYKNKIGWPRTSNLKVSLFGFAPPQKKNWSDGFFWPLLFKATKNRDFLAKRVLREITRGIVNHQTDAKSQAGMEDATCVFWVKNYFGSIMEMS